MTKLEHRHTGAITNEFMNMNGDSLVWSGGTGGKCEGREKTRLAPTRQDKTRQDKTRQDKKRTLFVQEGWRMR